MDRFDGKAILITGSTRGIGRAIARHLLERGAVVGIHGRDESVVRALCSELAGNADNAIPIAADFSDPLQAIRATETFTTRAGRIDGLVNNAGGGKARAFRGLTLDGWRRTFALNVEAALLASQTVYGPMRAQQGGAIVNIASLAAHGPGQWMGADYAAAKAALVSLTQSMAFEAARFGIRVNALSPGMIETDMTAALSPAMRSGLPIPMGRLGRPEEIAEAVAFLLSDNAAYIVGQTLHVNGGLSM